MSYYSKEEELLNRTTLMRLVTETEETDKYKITTLQDLKDKLTLISLPNNWLVWHRDIITTFFHPSLIERNITVNLYLEINCYPSTNAFAYGQNISITINSITDIRLIESILYELSSKYTSD